MYGDAVSTLVAEHGSNKRKSDTASQTLLLKNDKVLLFLNLSPRTLASCNA